MRDLKIDEVKRYWSKYPLGTREIGYRSGTKQFFEEQDRLRLEDNERFALHFYYFDENIKKGGGILDAGCGTGFFTRFYARMGYDVTAVDLTKEAVLLTRESLRIFALKANVLQGNLEDLQFKDNTFDYIICNGVVHHTANPKKAVLELYRVLKPGGKLSLEIYYRNIALRFPFWYLTRGLMRFSFVRDRERKGLLNARTPEDFVRSYDGDGTPIAELYSKEEAKDLVGPFKVLLMEPHYFPMRFFRVSNLLPSSIRSYLHRILDSLFGTLIYIMLEKPL